jgi:hypothetical protein
VLSQCLEHGLADGRTLLARRANGVYICLFSHTIIITYQLVLHIYIWDMFVAKMSTAEMLCVRVGRNIT